MKGQILFLRAIMKEGGTGRISFLGLRHMLRLETKLHSDSQVHKLRLT